VQRIAATRELNLDMLAIAFLGRGSDALFKECHRQNIEASLRATAPLRLRAYNPCGDRPTNQGAQQLTLSKGGTP